MFNMGGMEILVILVVALLVLGPDKLPRFMRTIGKAVNEVRRASTEFQRSINVNLDDEPDKISAGQTAKPTAIATAAEHLPAVDPESPAAGSAVPSGADEGHVAEPGPARRKLTRPRTHGTRPPLRKARRTGSATGKSDDDLEQV